METMPSSQKWLPVVATNVNVAAAWKTASQRHGLRLMRQATMAMSTAQPTCTDGMADSWSATPLPIGP